MKPLEILNRYPALGTVLSAALLVFVTIPKAYEGAQLSGAMAGGAVLDAEVRDLEIVERQGRRGRTVEDCYLQVRNESGLQSVRIACSDAKNFEPGQAIELIKLDDKTEVLGYPFSSYKFDLFLALTEIFGIFYFGRKFLRERKAPAQLPEQVVRHA